MEELNSICRAPLLPGLAKKLVYTRKEGDAEVLEIKIHNLHLFKIQVIINFARVSNISYICARMLVAGAS